MPTIIEKPLTIIAPNILKELSNVTSEQGQVVVHGICKARNDPMFIRIWPTTYLFDQQSSHVSELVHYEKISQFPTWTDVAPKTTKSFTLIFSGLPTSCVIFDLQEIIPQANGFFVPNILRNNTDIYYLDFTDPDF